MINIVYNTGCRNCCSSNGLDHTYLYDGKDQEDFYKKTAFEVATIIEKWHIEDNHCCNICEEINFDFLNIRIENVILSNLEDLTRECIYGGNQMLQLNISKSFSRYGLEYEVGGTIKFTEDAFNDIYQALWKHINNRPESDFNDKLEGNFYICISYKRNLKTLNFETKVEQYQIFGLTRDEIEEQITDSIDYGGYKFKSE